jgi:hypothetical protein
MSQRNPRLVKQEKGETGSDLRTVFPGGFSPRPQENKAAEQALISRSPLCFNFISHKKAQMCFTTSHPWSS